MEQASRKQKESERESGIGRENSIYQSRFNTNEEQVRLSTWQVLVPDFLQKYVSKDDVVIDLGAGDGHFITHVEAGRKIAVDLSSHVRELEKRGIEVVQCEATRMSQEIDCKVDIVFMSNFLEHLPTKRVLLEVMDACQDILKPGGRVMILQPNIRYVGPAYWDYVDHHIAITEHSLVEALEVSGFEVEELIPRFLPYTAKSVIGRSVKILNSFGITSQKLISWYLQFPIVWKIFGKQTFVVAKKI